MAVIVSRMYAALSGLREISIKRRPLFSRCVSLRMFSTLNTFLRTGYWFLLIPNLPLSSLPRWGCGSIILLRSSMAWRRIQFITFIPLIFILVLLLQNAFDIFSTAELTFVVCIQSTRVKLHSVLTKSSNGFLDSILSIHP
jgi:hypothetical protein